MIDLNPYFKKKLGESLVFKPDPKGSNDSEESSSRLY